MNKPMKGFTQRRRRIEWTYRKVLYPGFFLWGAKPARYRDDEPIWVGGLFRTASGIGQSARTFADALEREGRNVIRVDFSKAFNQIDLDFDGELLSPSQARASLSGFLVLHLNPPEFEEALFLLRPGLPSLRRARVVGYWAWELAVPPPSWKRFYHLASEIWVPSPFVAQALSGPKKTRVVSPFIDVPDAITHERPAPLSCLCVVDANSSLDRKNLSGAIEVAQRVQSLGCVFEFRIKCRDISEAELRQRFPNLPHDAKIIAHSMSREDMLALYQSSTVLLALHRAEGFGLHIAEAMAAGCTVMVTDWSGLTERLTDRDSIKVPCQLVPVKDSDGIYTGGQWAEPDLEFATYALRSLLESEDQQKRLRVEALRTIQKMCSTDSIMAALDSAKG